MQTIEYSFIDKSDLPDGPWQNEPDKIQWVDENTGMPCLIVRSQLIALCGYVGVEPRHPLYGKQYFDLNNDMDVHGGITYTGLCVEGDKEHGVCHTVEAGESDDVWWYGFDCAHYGDVVPKYGSSEVKKILGNDPIFMNGVYRNIDFVKRECAYLAAQLEERRSKWQKILRKYNQK